MKTWLFLFIFLSTGLPGWRWLMQVRAHNTAQAQGQTAQARGHAAEAVYYYQQAVAHTGRREPAPDLLLNLGQAQEQAGQTAAARATYARLLAPAVPPAIGSAARQQLAGLLAAQRQLAQAANLLRQALRLNPANATARYNYEVLSQYLAGQQPDNPALPPAADAPAPATPPPSARRDSTARQKNGPSPAPAEKAGTDHPGAAPTPTAAPPGGPAAAPQPGAGGQPNRQQPTPQAGATASGSFQPGTGERQPLPSGTAPGRQRGLDATAADGPPMATGQSRRPGTEAATSADLQLQTQRERLKAMNLTPAQAQQVLEALRESEQQYLQQRPRARQGAAPAPGQPTW